MTLTGSHLLVAGGFNLDSYGYQTQKVEVVSLDPEQLESRKPIRVADIPVDGPVGIDNSQGGVVDIGAE